MNSKFLSLNWLDVGKAFLVAFLAFAVKFLQETLIPSLDVSPEVKLLIITFLGYLIKNFFTGTVLKDDDIGGGGIKNPPKP